MKFPRWFGPGAVAFLLVWLMLLAVGRSAFFRDPGTFWHTTTGELILKDGFLRADPYTFTFGGQWWVPYQWLGEVGMALAHRIGGFDTQLLGAVTLIAAVFAWLTVRLQRTGLHPILVYGTVALALAAAGSHFHVRPHLFTLACMTVVAVALAETDVARPRLKRLFWLIPLCAVWTNVHGGVLGGIGTICIAFSGWVVFWKLKRPSPVRSWRDAGLLALVASGCGLSVLASPYGLDMVRTWHVIMDAPELREIISEHRPLDVTAPYAWPVLTLAAVYLFVLYGVKRSAIRVSWLLPLVWLALAFSRCRHVSLFAVVAVVTITAMWKHTRWALWLAAYRPDLYQPGSAEARPWWAHVWLPVTVVVLALTLQITCTPVPLIGSGWATHDPVAWPVDVLDVLKEHEPKPGDSNHLFNGEYIDGGFVIYHAPGYKVFVDDRCELMGGPWLVKFVHKSENPGNAIDDWQRKKEGDWQKKEEYGPFDFALTRTGTPFDEWFAKSTMWQAVKITPTATFYKRRVP
ncbi:Uncharacterized protein OS=Smithella sp. SCADC GN=ER57_03855 PE=4 SV=1 [Gemmata massiliana]|uniref:Glycosyltransferase RgtA/B/C/D-like domain-containing protein n=1 Tax=Gemmata massiliana TaxID=1210884 RepID=A0A6P2D462_9BACT|nr:hypothetical protein [Gemmata massiliana]VTR95873.1 Uncharacterized protein OS=Smithella sp. SCADC GN=ER57_03855 PE=4 SV=1 [Gemmata massiliana]